MNTKDKLLLLLGLMLVVFLVDVTSASEDNPSEYCIAWDDHVKHDEYVLGLEKQVKNMYLFFVAEQKRIAEDKWLHGRNKHEW
jgi:hypothetical protein|tara:strand:+ start:154 stop:402 length:249 start_codon:yes stop_codon:yes gene_type:complete